MQSPEALNDFNFRDITNNPAKASYVGKSSNGRKYVFPAEYDIFIDVSPYQYKSNSEETPTADGGGNVQIKVTHLTTNPTPAGDRSWSEVKRIEALAGAETTPTVVPDDASTTSARYNFKPEQQCFLSTRNIDSYQKMSWNSASEAQQDCANWCTDQFNSITNPDERYCCWYGKGKASGMGFEICNFSDGLETVDMDQQIFIDEGADEMEGVGAWIIKRDQEEAEEEEEEEEGAMNGLSVAIASSSALLMMALI